MIIAGPGSSWKDQMSAGKPESEIQLGKIIECGMRTQSFWESV